VILKLGGSNKHHFAHRSDSLCPATNPETALHFNVKLHLARELEAASKLRLPRHCVGIAERAGESAGKCHRVVTGLACEDWTSVAVERSLEGSRLRPDIAIYKSGEPALAIEVLVTHAVDEQKSRVLKGLGVPWVEVEAGESLFSSSHPWKADKPLPFSRYVRADGAPDRWQCRDCVAREERLKVEADSELVLVELKLVDFYYPSGGRSRKAYYIQERVYGGDVIEVQLNGRKGVTPLLVISGRATDENLRRLHAAFNEELIAHQRATRAIVDSPMPWTRSNNVLFKPDMVPHSTTLFPERYVWLKRERKWATPAKLRRIKWQTFNTAAV
jgi:hypothetical protein